MTKSKRQRGGRDGGFEVNAKTVTNSVKESCKSQKVQEPIETFFSAVRWNVLDAPTQATLSNEFIGDISLCMGSLEVLIPMINPSQSSIGVYRKISITAQREGTPISTTDVLRVIHKFYNYDMVDQEDIEYILLSGALDTNNNAALLAAADTTLSFEDIRQELIKKSSTLHFHQFLFGKTYLVGLKRQRDNIYLLQLDNLSE